MIVRKSEREIELIAAAGRVAADTIAHVGRHIEPGVTTDELDRLAEEYIRSHGGIPTSKGYRGFPKAICISPNDMIVHGIPGSYQVADGDLLTLDVGVTLDGYVADTAYTFAVGEVSAEAERLLEGLPRGPPDPELRHPGPGSAALLRDDPGDRADDHGGRRGHRPRRRPVVGLHRRWVAFGPFRAHRGGHRGRAQDPDPGRSRFATVVVGRKANFSCSFPGSREPGS
jgi:hypothetical protein